MLEGLGGRFFYNNFAQFSARTDAFKFDVAVGIFGGLQSGNYLPFGEEIPYQPSAAAVAHFRRKRNAAFGRKVFRHPKRNRNRAARARYFDVQDIADVFRNVVYKRARIIFVENPRLYLRLQFADFFGNLLVKTVFGLHFYAQNANAVSYNISSHFYLIIHEPLIAKFASGLSAYAS